VLGPFRETLRSPDLRRAELAFGILWASEWGFQVALSVIAFRDGGAAAVGIVAALRMVPAAVLAPVASAIADRLPRDRVLIAAGLARAAVLAGATVTLAAGMPTAATYALAVLATAAFTVVRPAHSALLPALARSPQELTSATVVRGLMDSAGTLAGPAIAAAVLAFASPEVVVGLVAGASAWAAGLIALIRYEPPPRVEAPRRALLHETLEGLSAMAHGGDARLVAGLAVVQIFVRGALTVLVVVLALEQLGAGDAGVGWLTAAIGAGAVAGSLGAGLLADGRNLGRWEGVGVALWGFPLLACAAAPEYAPALVFFAVAGVGNALVDVGLFTLPVRQVPDERLGRFFGVLESLGCVALAAGALVAPLAVDALGVRGALAAIGAVAPLATALAWPALRRIDHGMRARDAVVAVLRGSALLRPLPVPAIERLAKRSARLEVPAGSPVFAEGDVGDAFYVIAGGRATVSQGGQEIRTLDSGDGFGEIALLRPVERTATVTAARDLTLQAVTRADFLTAVTGFRPSAAAAEERVETLTAGDSLRSEWQS
jgi:MFS family permease